MGIFISTIINFQNLFNFAQGANEENTRVTILD